jgi:hypothetical protein
VASEMAMAMGMLLDDHVVVMPLVAPLVVPLAALLVVLPLVHALLVTHSMDLMGEVLPVPMVAMGMFSKYTTLCVLPCNTSYRIAHPVGDTSGHVS